MKNIFKQSEVLATNSDRTSFRSAVLRLTAYYSLGVFCVILVFSFLVYGLFSRSIDQRPHDDRPLVAESEGTLQEEIKENLLNILIYSDIVLLILAVMVSYLLSKKTLEPLEQSYKSQRRFVADAAHELRTPLAVMKAGAEVMLQKQRTSSEYEVFVRDSLEEIQSLITLSNDLLTLAKSSENGSVLNEQFNFSELCTKKVEGMKAYAQTKQITLNADIHPGVQILGSADMIGRVIVNVLKNAIDYNNPNGRVDISVATENQNIITKIRDTGIGMNPADVQHIFDRFYKADSARTHTMQSGSGLGLAIAKEIILAHGGAISVQSALGEGTEVHISLPAAL